MEESVAKNDLTQKSWYHKLRYFAVLVLFLSLIFLGWVLWYKVIPRPSPKIHYHAGFIVIQNNKKMDFSTAQYMDIESCRINSNTTKSMDAQEQQIEKAHLHDNIGDVVHVESSNALWKDLFTNLHYPISYKNTSAYINGNKINNFQTQRIQPYQSLVLFIGNNNDTQKFLNQAVTKSHIKEVEQKSEDCGSHG